MCLITFNYCNSHLPRSVIEELWFLPQLNNLSLLSFSPPCFRFSLFPFHQSVTSSPPLLYMPAPSSLSTPFPASFFPSRQLSSFILRKKTQASQNKAIMTLLERLLCIMPCNPPLQFSSEMT